MVASRSHTYGMCHNTVCDKTFGFPRNSQPGSVLGAAPTAHPSISFLGNEKETEIPTPTPVNQPKQPKLLPSPRALNV